MYACEAPCEFPIYLSAGVPVSISQLASVCWGHALWSRSLGTLGHSSGSQLSPRLPMLL